MRSVGVRILTYLAVVGLIAACGGADTAESSTTAIAGSSTSTVENTTTTELPETTEATQSTQLPATTTTDATPSTTVLASTTTIANPGEAIDIGPHAGDILAVVGVAHDDVLNVRVGPGVGFPVIGELSPTEDGLVATGETRSIPGALWIRVDADGTEGWINLRYVAYLGDTNDITAQVIEQLGARPETETMLDLGTLVAEAVTTAASGEAVPELVMSVAPTVGDLGEVTFDVVGLADDSVRGSRLHVFGTPSEGGEGFVLASVEATVFCARGVSDRLCS